jgi:hypothetical protein
VLSSWCYRLIDRHVVGRATALGAPRHGWRTGRYVFLGLSSLCGPAKYRVLTLPRVPAAAMLNGLGLGHLLPTFEAEELGLPLLQKMAEDPAECAMVLDEVGVGMRSTGLHSCCAHILHCHSVADDASRMGTGAVSRDKLIAALSQAPILPSAPPPP